MCISFIVISCVSTFYYSPSPVIFFFFFNDPAPTEIYTSFPTRRSSDLELPRRAVGGDLVVLDTLGGADQRSVLRGDRKSTRLNSSHVRISYAVFCLKKKKKNKPH